MSMSDAPATASIPHRARSFARVLVVVVGVLILLTLGSQRAKALDIAPITGTVSTTTDGLTDTVTDTTDTVTASITDTTDTVTSTVSGTTGTIEDLTGTVDDTLTGTVDTVTGTLDGTVNDVTNTVGDQTGTTGGPPPVGGSAGTTIDSGTTGVTPGATSRAGIDPAASRDAVQSDFLSASMPPTNVPNGSIPISPDDASAPMGGTTETAGHSLPFNAGLLGLALLLALAFGRWLRLSADTRAPDPFASPIEVPG
jgi:hypothetical protein